MNDMAPWHSIRPWRPTLSLSVREITSVSATFILSSPLVGDSLLTEQSLASLGISNDEQDDLESDSTSTSHRSQIVSDVLSKGLSVKVNGAPWQRVLMKIDDEADEAVIILFGLMPGRQYDVELGIVPNEKTLRSQITTDIAHQTVDFEGLHSMSLTDRQDAADQPIASTSSSQLLHLTASSSTNTAPSPLPSFSLEDRRMQLNHTLALLTAEHANLTTTLKSARRDSQKADAALRAEIEALKRASERAAPGELRARQKARALQEAARQAQTAAEQVKAQVEELERTLPSLVQQKEQLERAYERINKEARVVQSRREDAEVKEKKRTESKKTELASLTTRMDRLTARRDKLEGPDGVLNELEEKLRRLEEERERVENDPYGYSFDGSDEDEEAALNSPREDSFSSQPHTSPVRSNSHGHQHSRKRHSHPSGPSRIVPPPIARPEPVQRPALASLPSGPGIIHLPSSHSHSHSLPAVKKSPPAPSNNGGTSGSSTNPSPVPASASVLSSRAPPFAPRGLKSDLNPSSSPFEPRTAASLALASNQAKAGQKATNSWASS